MTGPKHAPEEVSAKEAGRLAADRHPLIDIRTERERLSGTPCGSVAVSHESLIQKNRGNTGNKAAGGLLICDSGERSLRLVHELRELGQFGFSSLTGGFKAWREAGLPVDAPEGLSVRQGERYARHLVMPQVGVEGQRKLLDSRMLLAGLGGLNSPAALYLAAAGVGCLGVVDFDRVERSNLQRQVIHGEPSLGLLKTESARQRLAELNPEVRVEVIGRRVDEGNADELVSDWDLVIDGTDNFPARYALGDACVRQSKPLVYGAVTRFQGQVSVFAGKPCFRCLLPHAPSSEEVPSCAEAGVLGVLPGIVGTLQANEALKIALGIGTPLYGRLLMFDALSVDFRQARIQARPDCPGCQQSPQA